MSKSFISLVESVKDLEPLIMAKTFELFKNAGLDLPKEEAYLVETDNGTLDLNIDVFSDVSDETEENKKIVEVAKRIGFTEFGYENTNFVLKQLYGADSEHTYDHDTDSVIIEFYNEADAIMSKIDELYNEMDNMNAIEAKQAVADLYAFLKNKHGWGK